MHKKVLILLNERENQKKEAAERLEAELKAEGITPSRFLPSPKTDKEIEALQPAVIVVDFILEDFGTGLDLLEKFLHGNNSAYKPHIVFYTDEPSLEVALSAMRLGADDYHLLTQEQSLYDCIGSIKTALTSDFQRETFIRTHNDLVSLDELVISSKAIKNVVEKIQLEINKQSNIVLLHGPKGSGKTALATACLKNKKLSPYIINFRYEVDSISAIFERHVRQIESKLSSVSPLHLILQNVEGHSSLLIDFLKNEFNSVLTTLKKLDPKPLFITTSDEQVEQALKSLLPVTSIAVPSLADERSEDITPLVQHFLFQAQKIKSDASKIKLSAKELNWFQEKSWPGNIPHIQEVVMSFALGEEHLEGSNTIEKLERAYEYNLPEENTQLEVLEDPLEILTALNRCRGNVAHAAAHLGCSVRELLIATQSNGDAFSTVES